MIGIQAIDWIATVIYLMDDGVDLGASDHGCLFASDFYCGVGMAISISHPCDTIMTH